MPAYETYGHGGHDIKEMAESCRLGQSDRLMVEPDTWLSDPRDLACGICRGEACAACSRAGALLDDCTHDLDQQHGWEEG